MVPASNKTPSCLLKTPENKHFQGAKKCETRTKGLFQNPHNLHVPFPKIAPSTLKSLDSSYIFYASSLWSSVPPWPLCKY
jgi:CRISPR/Cas system-associated endonuclease/helicase Cas3